MRFPFFEEAVAEYIRERLSKELAVPGTLAQIRRITGFTRLRLLAIVDGTSDCGPDLAQPLAEYWGMTGQRLHQIACEAKKRREKRKKLEENELLPNLIQTAEWCRGVYPDPFLDAYVAEAREQLNAVDRPKLEWLADLQFHCYRWIAEQATDSAKSSVLSQPAMPDRRNATVAMASPVGDRAASDPDRDTIHACSAEKRAETKGVIRKERSGVQVSPKVKANDEERGKAKAQ